MEDGTEVETYHFKNNPRLTQITSDTRLLSVYGAIWHEVLFWAFVRTWQLSLCDTTQASHNAHRAQTTTTLTKRIRFIWNFFYIYITFTIQYLTTWNDTLWHTIIFAKNLLLRWVISCVVLSLCQWCSKGPSISNKVEVGILTNYTAPLLPWPFCPIVIIFSLGHHLCVVLRCVVNQQAL